jgi:hypothetical protein
MLSLINFAYLSKKKKRIFCKLLQILINLSLQNREVRRCIVLIYKEGNPT